MILHGILFKHQFPVYLSIASYVSVRKIMAKSVKNIHPVIGVAQMTCTPDLETNFNMASSLIGKAAERGAKIVFLPECFDHICESRADTLASAETANGNIIAKYCKLAKEHDVWLSLGGMHEKPVAIAEKKIFNTHFIIGSDGNIKGRYSKTHLFDVDIKGGVRLKETDMTIPGNSIGPPVPTPVGNVGLAICYDVRFPELALILAQQGAHILTYPSAFTVPTGMAHWEVLLRSRAIETQCYVIAAAQLGKHHAKRSSYGHSMVVDPWGCVIAECSDQVDICVAEINLDYLEKRRQEMPVWNHRRYDLYGHLSAKIKSGLDDQEMYRFGQHSVSSSHVFYRTALSFAFVNRKPVLPGHVLVSPLRVAERFVDLTQAEVSDIFITAQKVSSVIENHYNGSSLTIAVQDGPEAGQTVKHFHVHILPRKHGDFQKNDDIYEALAEHDKNVKDNQWRTDEDMSTEAADLRSLF